MENLRITTILIIITKTIVINWTTWSYYKERMVLVVETTQFLIILGIAITIHVCSVLYDLRNIFPQSENQQRQHK